MEKLTRWNPTLSCPLAPCSVNNDFAQLCNIFDCLWHCACASQSTCLVTGYCVTVKALAAAAFGSHWSDMIMLYEVMLWLCYGFIMTLAGRNCLRCVLGSQSACPVLRLSPCNLGAQAHLQLYRLPPPSSRLSNLASPCLLPGG